MRTKISNVNTLAALAALAGAMAAGTAALPTAAAGVIGTLTNVPTNSISSPINISTGAADWIYFYGVTTPTTPDYKSAGPASFSRLSAIASGLVSEGFATTTDGIYLSFSGGTPDASAIADSNTLYSYGEQFTQTLFGPSETVQIYLRNYITNCNLSASLSSGGTSYSVANTAMSGGTNETGLLTLNVTGSIGDILTFSDTAVSPSGNNSVNIQAASATVVPEPTALALLAAAGTGLLLLRRRRA